MSKTIGFILSAAVDGPAIAYWAKGRNVRRDAEGNVVSFEVADGGPDGEPVQKGWRVFNERAIKRAREVLVNGKVDLSRSIRAQFVGPVDEWEYDDDGVDALVQVAFFGKIIYG